MCIFKMFRKNKGFAEKDLRCPRCNIVMKKHQKRDVIIDVCERCNGMWLDDQEIEKLVGYAKEESMRATRQESKSKPIKTKINNKSSRKSGNGTKRVKKNVKK